jgi:hypothetical protein
MSKPDLSKSFPSVDANLKISEHLDSRAHGPHYDAVQAIEGGTDQVRISPTGEIIGGSTNAKSGRESAQAGW